MLKYNNGNGLEKKAIASVTLPLKGERQTIQEVDYQTYCNTNIDYCIDFPFKVFTYATRSGEDFPLEYFVSNDQQATLFIDEQRYHHTDESGRPDLSGYFSSKKRYYTDPYFDTVYQVTKMRLYKNYCEFAGFKSNGLAFREIHFLKDKYIVRISFWFIRSQKSLYDKIAQQIIKSFK